MFSEHIKGGFVRGLTVRMLGLQASRFFLVSRSSCIIRSKPRLADAST